MSDVVDMKGQEHDEWDEESPYYEWDDLLEQRLEDEENDDDDFDLDWIF